MVRLPRALLKNYLFCPLLPLRGREPHFRFGVPANHLASLSFPFRCPATWVHQVWTSGLSPLWPTFSLNSHFLTAWYSNSILEDSISLTSSSPWAITWQYIYIYILYTHHLYIYIYYTHTTIYIYIYYTHTTIYIYIYIIHTPLYIYIYIYIYIIHTPLYIYIYIYYTHTTIYIYIYIYIYYTHTTIYIYIYIYIIHTPLYIYIYIYILYTHHYIYIYIYIYYTHTMAQRLECSPMARETWVQCQVESYQRL